MGLLHGLAVRVKASYFQTGSPSRCNQIISHAHSVHPLACVQEPKNPLTCCYLEHSRCYTPVSTFHIPSIQASQLKIYLSICAPHLVRHRLPFLSTEACGHGQAHKGAWATSLHGSSEPGEPKRSPHSLGVPGRHQQSPASRAYKPLGQAVLFSQ